MFKFSLILLLIISIEADAAYKIEKISNSNKFTEGPLWVKSNNPYLLFSDISENKVYKIDTSGILSVYIDGSGNSNGLCLNSNGQLVLAQHGSRQIGIYEDGTIKTLVSNYNGKKFNSPNDLCLRKSTGAIFFTDPAYGIEPKDEELGFYGVYCIPNGTNHAILLVDSLKKPNGIALSQDDWYLYVCDSETKRILRYEFKSDTSFKSAVIFASFDSEIDGLKTDLDGNVYVALSNTGILVLNNLGKIIDTIAVPEKTRNLAFGGIYGNYLYISAGNSIYRAKNLNNYPFVLNELLGKPSDKSVAINMLAEMDTEVFVEYGKLENSYNYSTQVYSFAANDPIEIELNDLEENTKYYYRIKYKIKGYNQFLERKPASFHTKRKSGESFTFSVHADPHLDYSSNYITYINALNNTLKSNPDFMIDLGDNFMTDKLKVKSFENIKERMFLLRHYYEKISNFVPIFLVIGNHEAENGWELNSNEDNIAITNTKLRKQYYPNPIPNDFYSGDATEYNIIGLRESYYSWTWGDALFVCIDPYWNTLKKPGMTKNSWDWTLGKQQYDWLKSTLKNSNAKYKFVFSHQLVGGDTEGRGGVEYVPYFEMGGNNLDGTNGFPFNRLNWELPIHQLFVEYGVNIFFHGHDHLYIRQELDGVVYQLVPQPSLYNYTGIEQAASYGYKGKIIPNSGHLNIHVDVDSCRIDYIRSYHVDNSKKNEINGKVEYSYYIYPNIINRINSDKTLKEEFNVQYYNQNDLKLIFQNINSCGTIIISNILGERITQFDTNIFGNYYCFTWDLRNELGEVIPNGVYFITFSYNGRELTRKFIKM